MLAIAFVPILAPWVGNQTTPSLSLMLAIAFVPILAIGIVAILSLGEYLELHGDRPV